MGHQDHFFNDTTLLAVHRELNPSPSLLSNVATWCFNTSYVAWDASIQVEPGSPWNYSSSADYRHQFPLKRGYFGGWSLCRTPLSFLSSLGSIFKFPEFLPHWCPGNTGNSIPGSFFCSWSRVGRKTLKAMAAVTYIFHIHSSAHPWIQTWNAGMLIFNTPTCKCMRTHLTCYSR